MLKIFAAILFFSIPALAQSYPCIQKDVKPGDIVSAKPKAGGNGIEKASVKQTLKKMKARCIKGKLIGSKGKEIRFFRLQGCWGNPPEDYLEIMANQERELAELRKKYAVIEMTCNPSGEPIP